MWNFFQVTHAIPQFLNDRNSILEDIVDDLFSDIE